MSAFIEESANFYAVSRNAVDLDAPIVPLYTDYLAGGTYGLINDSVRVTLDGNDPDAARGESSFKVTWDGTDVNGYFQFGVGTTVANRPRDIPAFGDAKNVRVLAKGDFPGQQVKVNVFRGLSGGGFQNIATQVLDLTTDWANYSVALPAGLKPSDLHAVQFVLGDGLDPGNLSFRLDEVRIETEGFDPLRVVQSYRPGAWAPTASNPETVPGRDLLIYPNRSFLYDNALAIKAMLASDDPAVRLIARDVADGILATAEPDGSFFNVRNSGHVLNGDGTSRDAYSQTQTLGDAAWFGLALVDVYRQTDDSTYLNAARSISDWAENNLKDTGTLKGYRGGFDENGIAFPWRATEHNIDFFALNKQLAIEFGAAYEARATHAGDFVMNMFDSVEGKFWTGTNAGDSINTGSVPLDAQLWAVLTLSQFTPYAGAIDWTRPLAWAEANLQSTDGSFSGFTFSDQSTPNRVWFEGTGHAAVVYNLLHQTAQYDDAVNTLEQARLQHPNGDGKGIVAASSNSLEDPVLGAIYDARLHTGATAWSYFAQSGINPFIPTLPLPQQTGQDFVVDDWDFKVTQNDLGFNYFGGNTGATETVEGTTTIELSDVSNGPMGGSLDVSFDFAGQATEVFAGYFASLFGLTDTLVSLDGSGVEPASTTPFPGYFLDTQDIYHGFLPFADRSVEQLQFDVRLESASDVTVKIELQDEDGFDVFTRRTFTDTGANWQTISLSLPADFNDSVQGSGDPSGFNWREVSTFSLIVERNNIGAGIANPDTGQFLIDNLQLVDNDGQYPDLDSIRDPLSGELIQFYEAGFLDHVRATSAQFFSDWASTDPRTGGIIQDRSSFADLMTVGGAGFQLTTYVIDAERGYITHDEAATRVRDILRVLYDQPQGPDRVGTIGHEGFFYHFLGIDGLRKQNFDFTATTEIDESLNTVELSTIDTALAVAGAVTAGEYFSGGSAIETEIRQLATDIYGRVNWPFMLNSDPGINSPRDERDMFFLGWKPNENRDGAPFDIPDALSEGSYSGTIGDPAVVDFYTDEGLLIALLAMGSPNPDHRLPRDVWDALIRETDGDSFVKTFPGSLFTYEFASVWLDTEALGIDNHQAINGRPALPVNFFDNSRAAMLATRDYAIANPNDRVTWQDGGGETRWGISAAEGPFDEYFAYGAPTAAQDENLGEFISAPAMYMVEAEDGTGDGSNMFRGNASGGLTVQLNAGESRTMAIDVPFKTQYEVLVRYSNDNFGPTESIEVSVDGNVVGSFLAQDTGDFGDGWNVFVENNPFGPIVLGPGTHDVTISVSGGDGGGVEVDQVTLQHGEVRRPLEDGTATVYGAGSAIQHVPEYAIAALWESRELGLLHPRFGFADAFNLEIADAVITETPGGEILRTSGPWANFTGYAIDHGPMLIMIDNYLENNFIPSLFMSNSGIDSALLQLFSESEIDYGDAPDPTFPTLVANDGAGHRLTSELFLGASVDGDPDGQPTAAADGDDTDGNDDEDGVLVNGALVPGLNASLTVTVGDGPGNGAFLDAWVDLDGDGTWSHPGEQILASRPVGHGSNVITFQLDPGAVPGTTYARFRLSSTGGLTPTGIADDGEVEDYEFEIAAPRIFVVDSTGSGGDLTPGDGVCQDIQGQCTLFAAIEETNASPNDPNNPDVIAFNIAGGGTQTIQSPLELPAITDAVVIDGTTQPGYAGQPLVELDGSLTASGASGLTIRIAGGGSVIRGLAINRFPGQGIFISRSDGNLIEQNHLGTDSTGTIDLGNGEAGLHILNGENNAVFGNLISGNEMGVVIEGPLSTGNVLQANVIGASAVSNPLKNRLVNVDVAAAPNNVIGGPGGSGNVVVGSKVGIGIRGSQATGNMVLGNYIGNTPAGTAIANNRGVEIKSSATNNTIGGPGDAGNVISGNTKGVLLSGVQNNLVHGNKIGTNAAGNAALPNVRGVLISGGSNNQIGNEPNVISGNTRDGLRILGAGATGNVISDNFIGTNAAGDAALANRNGVLISPGADGNTIGGTTAAERNVISGNTDAGILLQSDSNSVVGNYIGTDASCTSAIGNETGVLILGGSHNTIGGPVGSGAGNVISGNTEEGVRITGNGAIGNTTTGNLIGTDCSGMAALGNKHGVVIEWGEHTVGGPTASDGNVISGNTQNGVYLLGSDAVQNIIYNNRIGINIDGSGAVANARSGVLIEDAPGNKIGDADRGNSIGGNTQQGIRIAGAGATGNTVEGNSIGLDRVTMTAIANRDGVRITDNASNNTIGGAGGSANEIAFNTGRGVWITSGTGNTITQNSIHDNGGLGIDLSGSGNNLQDAPTLTSAISSGGNTTVAGTLNSTPNSSFTIEFFSSPTADPSGFGEGKTFLGSAVVNTDGGGDGNFAPSFSVDVPSGHFVTATATDAGGSTSEFSAVQPVSSMLQAAAGPAAASPAGGSPAGVSANQLQPIVYAAIDKLVAAGFTADLFENVKFAIADLPGATLGLATGNTITIDVNAAGYGWFVGQETRVKGPGPEDADADSGSRLSTPDARLRFDLLTVVMHELGHVAGLEDLDDGDLTDDLMDGWLTPGTRRTATEMADAAFAQLDRD